jgi:hypothetical protein
MTGNRVVLKLTAESREGIHDFIHILEKVLDDIKGGHESAKGSWVEWKIETYGEEDKSTAH